MKKILEKLRKEKGITGLDITTGAIVFFLFTTLIFTLFLQIYKQSSLIKIHQQAMGYIIDICEDIDLQDYNFTEDLQEYKNYIIDEIGLPQDNYNLTLSVEKYIETHPNAEDLVKKITVNIRYTFDGEEKSIEVNKIKVREL